MGITSGVVQDNHAAPERRRLQSMDCISDAVYHILSDHTTRSVVTRAVYLDNWGGIIERSLYISTLAVT